MNIESMPGSGLRAGEQFKNLRQEKIDELRKKIEEVGEKDPAEARRLAKQLMEVESVEGVI